jgi:hypothetical protein
MMKLTKYAIARMRTQIAEQPVAESEMRRVEGMGNLFMSRKRFVCDDEGEFIVGSMVYWHQYALMIDGVTYHFYAGAENGPKEGQHSQ